MHRCNACIWNFTLNFTFVCSKWEKRSATFSFYDFRKFCLNLFRFILVSLFFALFAWHEKVRDVFASVLFVIRCRNLSEKSNTSHKGAHFFRCKDNGGACLCFKVRFVRVFGFSVFGSFDHLHFDKRQRFSSKLWIHRKQPLPDTGFRILTRSPKRDKFHANISSKR